MAKFRGPLEWFPFCTLKTAFWENLQIKPKNSVSAYFMITDKTTGADRMNPSDTEMLEKNIT